MWRLFQYTCFFFKIFGFCSCWVRKLGWIIWRNREKEFAHKEEGKNRTDKYNPHKCIVYNFNHLYVFFFFLLPMTCGSFSCWVVSNHFGWCGLKPTRLLCPWDFPARILEWVAISSSRGSCLPWDPAHISCIDRWILYHWATWKTSHFYTHDLSLVSIRIMWDNEREHVS